MRESRLFLIAAVMALTAALVGCRKYKGEDNPSSKSFTVTFVSNGGNGVSAQTVANGDKLTEPPAPTRDGYIFGGWYTDSNTSVDKWDFASRSVISDITLYAKWLEGIAIYTAADLDAIRNNLYGNYLLMNDISLVDYRTDEGWEPIGNRDTPFTGKLDGNGHKITGLAINRPAGYYVGLFGSISGGSVNNLGVEISSGGVNGNGEVGSIAGYIEGGSTIIKCYSTGNVTTIFASNSCSSGGIAGGGDSSTITDCYSTGNISSDRNSGGIVGNISNSTITNCYSTGSITAYSSVGGIAGSLYISTITNCYSTGDVSASSSWSMSGGMAGDLYSSTITNCYSTGNISASSSSGDSGGIVGDATYGSTITNCAAINPAVSANCVGRIAGYIDSFNGAFTISNNFALSTMALTGVYLNMDPTVNTSKRGVNKTNAQLQTQSSYSDASNGDGLGGLGWKFGNNDANPWKMPAGGVGYPILYW